MCLGLAHHLAQRAATGGGGKARGPEAEGRVSTFDGELAALHRLQVDYGREWRIWRSTPDPGGRSGWYATRRRHSAIDVGRGLWPTLGRTPPRNCARSRPPRSGRPRPASLRHRPARCRTSSGAGACQAMGAPWHRRHRGVSGKRRRVPMLLRPPLPCALDARPCGVLALQGQGWATAPLPQSGCAWW